jgi:hypothetical protein
MKQHGVVLDLISDQILFTGGHCQHVGAPPTRKLISQVRPNESPTPMTMHTTPPMLQDLVQDKEYIPIPLRKKRRRPKPKSQRPIQIHETKIQETIQEQEKDSTIAIIGAAPFYHLIKKQDYQVFAVSMKDILYEQRKQERQEQEEEIDPKTILPKEFHDFLDVFSKAAADTLPSHGPSDHHITLEGDVKLGYSPLYNMSKDEQEIMRKYVYEHLSKDFIHKSTAPFASPVLFVRKPSGGLRFCVDYRKLNAITKKDRYPLPLIEETLAQITGAKFLTKIDIRHAFNRIRMATEEDEDLTTFRTSIGCFKYKVMPFGLTNGPATFQRHMNETLWEYLHKFVVAYMDDLLIYSQTREEHIIHVQKVLQKLRDAGLQADIKKCEFFV